MTKTTTTSISLVPPTEAVVSIYPDTKPKTVRLVSRNPTKLPELWCAIFIVGSEPYQFPQLFARAKCWKAKTIEEADIVLFTGGIADVSPAMYGARPHKETMSEAEEDMRDILVFLEAVTLGVPMIGVCRGAQFGNVMNGGKLFQHVDQHNKNHEIFVRRNQYYMTASSVHHQMCMPNEEGGMEIIAEAYESTGKWSDDKTYKSSHTDFDVEAFWYPETAFLGFQGHPEYAGVEEYTKFFIEIIEQYIATNPDLKIIEGKQRLDKAIMEQRSWRIPDTVNEFIKEYS